ncbi:MAG: IPTL-CTERM sorting domain-containing protein [Planctomycetota bacterium]|jgi:formylglycine-generating enzyme required for sulfatase activity
MLRFRNAIVAVVGLVCVSGVQAFDMGWVTVGNPGNANDTHGDGYGDVGYVYNIGKFEVTAGQYTEFLNAVAATDTYGLYNPSMWSSPKGCRIEQTGSSGSYTYSVAGDWADRPVNFVSWGDAARFANWLHNGQPGLDDPVPQDENSTEDGSYGLGGALSDSELVAVMRKPDATWVIPSENEWYKAAYYDGGSSVYYDYPTGTDDPPSNVLSNPDADPGNNANFYAGDGDYTLGGPYWRTEVGEFENSESPYGTFDQGGNVSEWTEATIQSYRFIRGGSFLSPNDGLLAASRPVLNPSHEHYDGTVGFRVAEVEPPVPAVSEWGLAMLVLAMLAAGLVVLRRSGRVGSC